MDYQNPSNISAKISTAIPFSSWCANIETNLDNENICTIYNDDPPLFLIDTQALHLRFFGEPSVWTFDNLTSIPPTSISKWIIWVGEVDEEEPIPFILYDIKHYTDALGDCDQNKGSQEGKSDKECEWVPMRNPRYECKKGMLVVIINKYTGNQTDEDLNTEIFTEETPNNNLDSNWEKRNTIRRKINECFRDPTVYSMANIIHKDSPIDYFDLDTSSKEKLAEIARNINTDARDYRLVNVDDEYIPFDVGKANYIIDHLIEKTNNSTFYA